MSNRVLSIEIDNFLTKICEMDFKANKPKVYNCLSIPTPDGAIMDGMLQASKELEDAIKAGLSEKGIKTKQAVFTIASAKIASREAAIPNVKANRIESVVKANAADYFPIDLQNYQIGYHKITDEVIDNKLKIMVIAVPKNLLESYYELAANCGLEITAFDYSSNSIYQIMKEKCADNVTMALKVDESSTIVTVIKNEQILLQRTVASGVREAVETLMESEAYGRPDYKEAIALLRRKTCINRTLNPTDREWDIETEQDDAENDQRVKEAKQNITVALTGMIGSISRVMDFYNSRNAQEPIANVYLTGLGGDFSGLSKLLTNCLEIKVRVLTQIDGVTLNRNMREVSFGEYIACLGAVLNPVGLVDKESQNAHGITVVSGTNYTFVSVAILILGIVLAGAFSITSVTRYATAEANKASLQLQITALSPVQAIYDEYTAAQAQSAKYDYFYQYTRTPNENLVEFINELEKILPNSFMTDSFTSSETGINMTVTVNGKPAAALTIKNIRDMESIENVEVSGITESQAEGEEVKVTFSISGTYKPLTADAENTVQ